MRKALQKETEAAESRAGYAVGREAYTHPHGCRGAA
jgi:hypothetical protein